MDVRTTGHEPEALVSKCLCEHRGVLHDLGRIGPEARVHCLTEGDRLAGDDVLERSALQAGKHRFVDCRCMGSLREHATAARAAKRLVRGESDHVGELHRVRVLAARDEPGDVRSIEHQQRPYLVRYRPERHRVEPTRVRGGTGHDHLGPVLERKRPNLIHVDALVTGRHLVRKEVVQATAEVDRRPVGEVATVIEREPQHGVARLEEAEVHGHVCVRARVRLHVRVLRSEQRADTVYCQLLNVVDDLVAAVVPLAGIALAVLVGENRSDSTHHCGRREVLAGDQLEAGDLALDLAVDEREHVEVWVDVGGERHTRTSLRRTGRGGTT